MEHKVAGVSTTGTIAGGDGTLTVFVCVCGVYYEAHDEQQRERASEVMQEHIGARAGT